MENFFNRQCPENHYPYIIQEGDTLYGISQRLGVELSRIIQANPGINPNNLQIGQSICIPACPENHSEYIIQAGDTLSKIAAIYNVSVDNILKSNPGLDPNYLRIGQRICIPTNTRCSIIVAAILRDINRLKAESRVQQAYESNYAYSNKITHVIEVTPDQILFDAVPVVFSGNYLGRFFPGQNYPYYEDAAMGGQRFLNVKDNFGIWHSFAYRVPV
ncbi:MAG TPA: LysM peptidoglycan-binding domain-containing protein [Defluviitaleaceae bacterium]|nr:LysM peptidoglycan-binding domain-containing protein [Defluviitaleaceae bacterium]